MFHFPLQIDLTCRKNDVKLHLTTTSRFGFRDKHPLLGKLHIAVQLIIFRNVKRKTELHLAALVARNSTKVLTAPLGHEMRYRIALTQLDSVDFQHRCFIVGFSCNRKEKSEVLQMCLMVAEYSQNS